MLSVGFHISKDCLSIAELSLVNGKPVIVSVNEVFWNSADKDEDKQKILSEEIQKISKKHKGQNLRFSYSIPQNLVSCFSVQFPFKERFRILKTLPFEIEDRTPFHSDKVFFDALITQIKDKQSADILCFLTPKENVNLLLDFLKPLKKPIHLLSCSAASLSHLLQRWDTSLSKAQHSKSNAVYIYLGDRSSCFFLYKDGFLNRVSALNWSCLNFIEEMEKIYQLKREKAWSEFFEKAFILKELKGFTKEQRLFSNMAKKHIQPLIEELNLQKISLETEHQLELSKWTIFGPGAMIKNLSVFLTEELGRPVSKLQSLEPFPHWDWREKALSIEAVGLALEGLKRMPYPGLNFLHFMKKETLFLSKELRKKLLLFLSCFFIFSSYAIFKKAETLKLLDKAQELFLDYSQKIAYLPKDKVSLSSVEKFLKNQQGRIEAEKTIQKELAVGSPILYLEKIIQKTGSAEDWDLSINFLKISGRKVTIKGHIADSKLKSFESVLASLSSLPLTNQISDLKEGSVDESSSVQALSGQTDEGAEVKEDLIKTEDLSDKKLNKKLNKKGSAFSYSFELKDF